MLATVCKVTRVPRELDACLGRCIARECGRGLVDRGRGNGRDRESGRVKPCFM